MITFKEYINERIDDSDYTASSEKSKFDKGHRALDDAMFKFQKTHKIIETGER